MTRITLEIDIPDDEAAEAVAPVLPYLKEIAVAVRRARCTASLTIDGQPVEDEMGSLT